MATLRVLSAGAVTADPPRLRVLRASVESSGTAKLRVLRVAVATDTGIAANAGTPVTADSRDVVFISGAASGGAPVGWTWTQTAGPTVTLEPSNTVAEPFFVAPATDTGTTVTFSLTVRNANGTSSTNPATVSVTVRPHIEWAYLGGSWLPVTTDVAAVPAPPVTRQSAADAAVMADDPAAFFPLGVGAGVTQDANGGSLAAVAFGFPGTTTMPNGDPAAVLDGIADYFEVADDPALSPAETGQLTVEMWLRPDVLTFPVEEARTTDPYIHFAGKGTAGQHEYAMRLYSATREDGTPATLANRFAGLAFNLAGGVAPAASWQGGVASLDDGTPPVLVVGQWVHVAMVVDFINRDASGAGVLSLYRNGVLMSHVAMTGVTPGNGSAPFRIGTRDLASYFQGAVGKVAVYQTAVSQARLLAHFQAMTGTGIAGPAV